MFPFPFQMRLSFLFLHPFQAPLDAADLTRATTVPRNCLPSPLASDLSADLFVPTLRETKLGTPPGVLGALLSYVIWHRPTCDRRTLAPDDGEHVAFLQEIC